MRKHELLSDNERKQFLNFPENRDDLVRLYTFEPMEMDLIRQRREDHNRLGVALQLALLRHPGMTMSQMLDNGGLPDNLVIFIAEQIDIPVQTLSDYGLRGQTMTGHARELALALGMRPAARSDIPLMIEAAASSAWAADKGMPIASGIVEARRQAKIVLPALATIERAGIAGRARARKLATQTLVSGLKPAQVEMLDKLFIADPATGISPLAWLKAIPVASKPDNVREIIDRLMFVRKIIVTTVCLCAYAAESYTRA